MSDGATQVGGTAQAEPRSGSGLKAVILEGDAVVGTTELEAIRRAHREGLRFWVELDGRTRDADTLLTDVLGLHALAIEDIWNDVGIPKVEDFGDYVQLVMHGVRAEDVEGQDIPITLAELDVVIGPHFIVTHAPDETVCAIAPVFAEACRSPRLLRKGPAWIAHAVLDRMVDEYLPVVNRFEGQIEAIETHILEGRPKRKNHRDVMRRVLYIKRSLQLLRRTTISQREILSRLARAEFDEIPREAMPFYRDVYDHFARVTELVDTYRELATGLLEAHFSIQSHQMNEIMKRLTLISTIMLPLSLVAGIYGMNFKRQPELEWDYGYAYALGLMLAIATLIVLYFKKKRWL